MPGTDGIETLSRILAIDNKIPVILNTAYSSYKDNFMTWAADAYVVKSSNLSALKQQIAEVLQKRGIEPAKPTEAEN
jgi:DNA-binding NarL/FixJ family response regulator